MEADSEAVVILDLLESPGVASVVLPGFPVALAAPDAQTAVELAVEEASAAAEAVWAAAVASPAEGLAPLWWMESHSPH